MSSTIFDVAHLLSFCYSVYYSWKDKQNTSMGSKNMHFYGILSTIYLYFMGDFIRYINL